MSEYDETISDKSSSTQEEDSNEYYGDESEAHSLNFSVLHNNNGSFAEHKVLSTEQVYSLMENEMKRVQEVTNICASKSRSLLNEYKWDTAKLLESLLEDNKKVNKIIQNAWEYAACDVRKSFECQVCFDEVFPSRIRRLECNHRFCIECLKDYITGLIKDGGLLVSAINCPGFNCRYELDDKFVFEVLRDKTLKGKYLQIIGNTFVQNHPFMKWCPNADCQQAVQLEPFEKTSYRESVRCGCGIFFCFKCQNLSHDPVECSLIVEWAQVRSEDFEAQNWILHNTKACPQCKVNIQKNGGCMHITCKCRYEFCWVCMANWSVRHNCRNDDSVIPTADAMKNLRRFSTYNAKHETMKQAYELDVAQYKAKLEQGTTELELEQQWVKIEFIGQAIEVLLQCRRTLMHAYIFSYFMTTMNNQMNIFEENLHYLEQCTEQLSEVLESDVTASNVGKMKEKIIDSRALCEKRRRSLMDHIIEGYDESWWRKFPVPVEDLIKAEMNNLEEFMHEFLY